MKEKIIARLHLEQFIQDEVLFYSIVLYEKEIYYICICAHFVYLFKESFTSAPIPIALEQIHCVNVYSDHVSKFSIVVVANKNTLSARGDDDGEHNNNGSLSRTTCHDTSTLNGNHNNNNTSDSKSSSSQQTMTNSSSLTHTLTLEASNRTQLIKELQIHYKTNKVLKKWQFDKDMDYDLKIVYKNYLATTSENLSSSSSSSMSHSNDETIKNPLQTLKLDRLHIVNTNSSVLKYLQTNSPSVRVEKVFNGYWFVLNSTELNRKVVSMTGSSISTNNNNNGGNTGGNNNNSLELKSMNNNSSKAYHDVTFESKGNSQASIVPDKLTVKIIPIRNSNAPKTNIRTFAQKMISNQLLTSCADFDVLLDEEFLKERSIYKFDKTITEAYQIKVKYCYYPQLFTSKPKHSKRYDAFNLDLLHDSQSSILPHDRIKHVVVCRRRFIPPYATHYQDIVFEYDYADNSSKAASQNELFNMCVQSCNPLPQCFLYDQLTIRTKLESLACDEDFYCWVQLKFGLKPELYPLKWGHEVGDHTRPEIFVKAVGDVIDCILSQPKDPSTIHDPFSVEHDLVYNVDSPDTVKNPTIQHIIQWRNKISYYLAYYSDSIEYSSFERIVKALLHLKQIGELAKDKKMQHYKRTLILLMEYFLHLRIVNQEYDFEKPIEEKIEEIEQKTDEMHYSFFDMNQMNIAVQHQMNATVQGAASSSSGGLTQFNDDILYDEAVEKHVEQLKNNQLAKQLQLIMYRQMLIGGKNNIGASSGGGGGAVSSNHTSRTVCNMNTTVFLRLMKLNYFVGVLGMSPLSFVKLLSNAIHVSSMYHYETIYEICYEITSWLNKCEMDTSRSTVGSISSPHTILHDNSATTDTDSTSSNEAIDKISEERKLYLQIRETLCSYTPFLHSLCSLLQYDDEGLLGVVASILEKLTYFSENVRKWFTSNDYLQFLVDHIEAFNSRTQPYLASCFLRVLRNCCNTSEKRSVITKDGELVPLVVRHILPNILSALIPESVAYSEKYPSLMNTIPFESSQREELLKSALDALLVIVQSSSEHEIGGEDEDELMSELIVNETSIHTLIELLGHVVRRMMIAQQQQPSSNSSPSSSNMNLSSGNFASIRIPSYLTSLLSILLALSSHEYFRGVAISIVLSGFSGSVIRGLHRSIANSQTLITLLVQILNILMPFIPNGNHNNGFVTFNGNVFNNGGNNSGNHSVMLQQLHRSGRRGGGSTIHEQQAQSVSPTNASREGSSNHASSASGNNTPSASSNSNGSCPMLVEQLAQLRLNITLVLSTLLMLSSNSKALAEMKDNMLEILIREFEGKTSQLQLPSEMTTNSENNYTDASPANIIGSSSTISSASTIVKVITSVTTHLQNRLRNGVSNGKSGNPTSPTSSNASSSRLRFNL
ncbi:hypothetical protein C9374_014140 [Naegleria lovaniensis]|uniref:Uncharacterized protein n=1 Tax=Naegleria lovaniensis TaxID=51637 RepID=A0AA88GYU7_NAELO|nr:uncharacterized protein C9374_014140 [Naegleria lovaniensis]KAG2389580.1 hypothetical protein C9374_014140 [Naegleria lovaniensis]